ncbi:calmodulin-regulated spectrin-associated protein 3-like isoform X1 [Syngnathus scovelli]|uniref:calmodulin-regulated spectrin-associated protein 3-like isoform X1 n=1 Tax=Syngnathus scovelli TaxID=161590 RepID=UPI002110565E|nr:calmodulin-regulated spectrin-associated protein 3-like isoform X1 [Syngnathus scovelli]
MEYSLKSIHFSPSSSNSSSPFYRRSVRLSAAMVDSGPGEATSTKKPFSVLEIPPLDQFDFGRAKIRANVRWLLCKSYGCAENVPVEMREPLYKDQYDQEHLKPAISELLLSPEIYCKAQALLLQTPGGPSASQNSPSDHCALLQFLTKKGVAPQVQDVDVTEDDLRCTPIKMKAHLALMDSMISLAAREIVDRVKMPAGAEQMGVGAPWENALLFWVNRLNQKLKESTEEEETPQRSQQNTDVQASQETGPPTRWYWKLVPHAIAFCLKESGNKPPVIRYRKDKVQSKLTPTFPLVSAVKDLSNGCAIAAVLHFYCPGLLPLEDVCLKDTMSVADSLYNLHLIKELCESSLQSCCLLSPEDLLYAPPLLHLNIMSFVAELLEWFEVKKPDFVQPIQSIDLTDVSSLAFCTSPVSGNSNSGSPSYIFKHPFVTVPSPLSPENKTWTKKQISHPLSSATFSIPFGLDSDVDIVMGNPIDSVFRSASTDSLGTSIPATTTLAGITRIPYSSPVSASAPSQRSSWGPYMHPAPLGELPTVEEALQVPPGAKDRNKGRTAVKDVLTARPESRLCPEGAPAVFFLHSPLEDNSQLSHSAPCRSGVIYRPVCGEASNNGGRGERKARQTNGAARDDDSSEAFDDTPRNAPGNMRPGKSHQGDYSPRMTSFAEKRDGKRRHTVASGEDFSTTPTATTPGTPLTPCTPAGTQSQKVNPGFKVPETGSEDWELGARLEEKRKSIEAQKRRIEAIFVKHRQRLGKTAFLKMKREQGEGGGEGADEDNVSLEERLARIEEQLKREEEKEKTEKEVEKEKAKPSISNAPRLEKQVTFSIDSKKGQEQEKGPEKVGGGMLVEYNEIVQKLSEALQSLQKDMHKLTEQQQELLGNQRPRSSQKVTAKSRPKSNTKAPAKTPPATPTKTPPRTPTKSTSKAWMIPNGSKTSSVSPSSRRTNPLSAATSPKTMVSSSCPAPRTKIHISSTPRSPKHHPRPQAHPRPSELKFPPLNRVLTPTRTVDTLPHLRRVSPSKCQVQTTSSFRIGGLPEISQPAPQPHHSTSDTASCETPTQFSLELEQDDAEAAVVPVPPPPRATSGSSSGAPSECSFESETLSISAAYSTERDGAKAAERHCGIIEVSLSSLGEAEGGTDEPTDEGRDFSSDSMSDQLESAVEPAVINSDSPEQLDSATEAGNSSDQQTESSHADAAEPLGENELGARGGIGFYFKEDVENEDEMSQRKALLLERQQRRAEELKRRRQEQEHEKIMESSNKTASSPSNTPRVGKISPCPTSPATPVRRGGFTRAEYARRQQLRIMDDLDKMLQQKKSTNLGRSPVKKTRPPRPRSVTREETQLSLSPAKKATVPKLTKSHSSLNLAAGDNDGDKEVQRKPDLPAGSATPSGLANQNGDWDAGSNGTSPALEHTGLKLFKEPSFKSNKFIIHNALSRCCLAGKVNEPQKNKIVEEMEKSPANHFLILFRDVNCQFRGVYTANPDSAELVRLTGVGPKTVSSTQVESMYKYSSDRKQFSAIPSKTLGMSVDAFTIPGYLWHAGGAAATGGGGGSSRRASLAKTLVSK